MDDLSIDIANLCAEFRWLEHHADSGYLFCQPCVDLENDAFFPPSSSCQDILRAHETTDDHVRAMNTQSVSKLDIYSTYPWPVEDHKINHGDSDDSTDMQQEKYDVSDHNASIDSVTQMEDGQASLNTSASHSGRNGDSISAFDEEYRPKQKRKPKERRVRRFCDHWLAQFPWLYYDREQNRMFCKLCRRYCQHRTGSNSFIKGNQCFKLVSLSAHAGSMDHQLAEKCKKLSQGPDTNSDTSQDSGISAQQKFFLKKYMKLFSWLAYRADVQLIICEICDRHTRNTLFIDARNTLDVESIQRHQHLQLHLAAEETEVKSWSLAWDTMIKKGINTETELQTEVSTSDVERRCTPLFTDTSLKVNGTEQEMVIANSDNFDQSPLKEINHQLSVPFELENSTNVSSDGPESIDQSEHSSPHTSSRPNSKVKNPYVKKKNSFLPVFGAFKKKWLSEFPWLHYDSQKNIMKCLFCAKHSKKMSFASGVRVFSRSYIVCHMSLKKHAEAARKEGFSVPSVPGRRRKNRPPKNNLHLPFFSECSAEVPVPVEPGPTLDPSITEDPSTECYQSSPQENQLSSTDVLIKTEPEEVETFSNEHDASYNSPLIQSATPQPVSTPKPKRKRYFCANWTSQFPWVQHDAETNMMTCTWCIKYGFNSSFTRGSQSFHIDSLRAHDGSVLHQKAAGLEAGE